MGCLLTAGTDQLELSVWKWPPSLVNNLTWNDNRSSGRPTSDALADGAD